MNEGMNFLLIFQQVWVKMSWLLDIGVSKKTILNGCNEPPKKGKPKTKWISTINNFEPGNRLILYTSIPAETSRKHQLPSVHTVGKIAWSYADAPELKSSYDQIRFSALLVRLQNAINQNWYSHLDFYSGLCLKKDVRKNYAKTHAAFEEMLVMLSQGEKLKTLHFLYNKVQIANSLTYKEVSYSTFTKTIKKGIDDISSAILHGLIGRKSNNSKLDEYWDLKIDHFYRKHQNASVAQIVKMINRLRKQEGLDEVSYNTVLLRLKNPVRRNKNLLLRLGEIKYQERFRAYAKISSKKLNEVWEIDGTRLPFYVQTFDKNGKRDLKVFDYMIVLETYSKKIIGWAIGQNENSELIKQTLSDAILNTKKIPNVLVHDGFSGYQSQNLTQFRTETSFMGMEMYKHAPGQAFSKGSVEKVQDILSEEYLNLQEGFLGGGITSKRENARPSREKLIENYKWDNAWTIERLYDMLTDAIKSYNGAKGKNEKLSREFKYELANQTTEKSGGINFSASNFALTFGNIKNLKIRGGNLRFTEDSKTFDYEVPSKHRLQLTDERVKVAFNPYSPKTIYVFDPTTEEFICTMDRITEIGRLKKNRTAEERELANRLKKNNTDYFNNVKRMVKNELDKMQSFERQKLEYSNAIHGFHSKTDVKDAYLKFVQQSSGEIVSKRGFEKIEEKNEVHKIIIKNKKSLLEKR